MRISPVAHLSVRTPAGVSGNLRHRGRGRSFPETAGPRFGGVNVAKRRNWTVEWPALAFMALVLLFVGVTGLWGFVARKSPPVHPGPSDVPATGASPSPEWASAVERARELVRAGLAERNVPGASVAVGVGDRIVWAEGFGWADIESRQPVTPDTRFRIGTTSIALTSAAAGVLLEEGRLSLDEEIQRYVPDFPRQPSPVTLRQVMGH